MKKMIPGCLILGLILLLNPVHSVAQDDVVKLPAPQTDGGKPLMQALKLRQSTRGDFGPDTPLSMQTISNLLWSANGVNRTQGNHRTAPTAAGWQNIDIYVATPDGLFLYDAIAHSLKVIAKTDVRASSGLEGPASGMMRQDFAKTAPCSLIYVADTGKDAGMKWEGEDVGPILSFTNAGTMAQNVYLYCASEGLACILRAMIDPKQLATVLKLRPEQKAILTTTIGHFK